MQSLLKSTTLRFIAMLSMVTTAYAVSGDEISREYKIKAAYLYNLTKFIDWPLNALSADDTPIKICVYGYNPFENHLQRLESRSVRGHPLSIRLLQQPEEVDQCHLIYFSEQPPRAIDQAFQRALRRSILMVGEQGDFLQQGGHIGLTVEENNVLLNINLTNARRDGFKVRTELLDVAKRVE